MTAEQIKNMVSELSIKLNESDEELFQQMLMSLAESEKSLQELIG